MKAALAAREDPDFVIIGRTGAASSTGVADCLERIAAYQDAGVDAIFLSGVKTQPDLEALARACRVPLLLGALPDALSKPSELARLGVRALITGHRPHSAAVRATYETLRDARAGTLGPRPDGEAEMMERLSRTDQYAAWRRDFLSSESK